MADRTVSVTFKFNFAGTQAQFAKLRSEVSKMGGQFKQVGRAGQTAFQRVNSLANIVASTLRSIIRTSAIGAVFGSIGRLFMQLNKTARAIKSVASEMVVLNLQAAKTAAVISRGGSDFSSVFREAATTARELSTQVALGAGDIQKGLFRAAQSGLNLAESFKVTESAMQLATFSGEDFETTLNSLIGTTRAFGIELNKMPQFADALTAATVESKVGLGQLFEGLKNVASISATAFGESEDTFLDTSAALMTLNDAGIEGSKAGVRLRAAFQKLLGGTARTNQAFTKYGVNLFKADAQSQQYLDTLIKFQKATSGTEEKLNALKNKQLELVIAGRENTREYKQLEDQLSETEGKLSTLESGVDNVFNQFRLAGGQIKPLAEILDDISGKAPTEVIGRAFGIRGGEGIMRLLKDLNKFKKFKKTLQEYVAESKKGESVLKNIFGRFLETAAIKWQKLKNTGMAVFGELADSALEAFSPLLDPLLEGFKALFKSIQKNRKAITEFFTNVANQAVPILNSLKDGIMSIASVMADVFDSKKSILLPFADTSGEDVFKTNQVEVSGSVQDKFGAAVRSFSSLLGMAISSVFKKLQPLVSILGEVFGASVLVQLQKDLSMIKSLGKEIGVSIGEGLVEYIKSSIKGRAFEIGQGTAGQFMSDPIGTLSNMSPLRGISNALFKQKDMTDILNMQGAATTRALQLGKLDKKKTDGVSDSSVMVVNGQRISANMLGGMNNSQSTAYFNQLMASNQRTTSNLITNEDIRLMEARNNMQKTRNRVNASRREDAQHKLRSN